jgi:hypothetical protein
MPQLFSDKTAAHIILDLLFDRHRQAGDKQRPTLVRGADCHHASAAPSPILLLCVHNSQSHFIINNSTTKTYSVE